MTNPSDLPIIIVGGCVGLLSLGLGRASIPVLAHLTPLSYALPAHSTATKRTFPQVLETPTTPGTESKRWRTSAPAHQHSTFPEFVRAGVMDELASEGLFSTGICFRKTRDGEVVAGRRFEKGEKAQLSLPQWRF